MTFHTPDRKIQEKYSFYKYIFRFYDLMPILKACCPTVRRTGIVRFILIAHNIASVLLSHTIKVRDKRTKNNII